MAISRAAATRSKSIPQLKTMGMGWGLSVFTNTFFILFILIPSIVFYRAPIRNNSRRRSIQVGVIAFAINWFAIYDGTFRMNGPDVVYRNGEIILVENHQ